MQHYLQRARFPSLDLSYSGLFASHFFDINCDLDPITDLVTTKLFSVSGQEGWILVIGLTGSEDGGNRHPKTDIVLVIDRSGSIRYSVKDIVFPGATDGDRADPEEKRRSNKELTVEAAKAIFDLFDEIIDVVTDLKAKGTIDRNVLFEQLDTIEPRAQLTLASVYPRQLRCSANRQPTTGTNESFS
jgi:hypothetical protein